MTSPNPDFVQNPTTESPSFSTERLQVVNYEEEFNKALHSFLDINQISNLGFDYHVAAIMGPQSSGKSTLLNLLFGTQFRTMDESSGRYQVTQGVWLSRDSEKGILVMDLEGTDSRERGEDAATYERKSSLFALALAEVLIVNVWAQDVGRYNAANMSLLKTVMELDLQLFFGGAAAEPAQVVEHQNGSPIEPQGNPRMHKTRLLFVLRDHVSSPFETLCNTLRADVANIWDTISKPEAAKDTPVTNYFDIDFFALPHKVLMHEEFYAKGKELRRRFHENEVFLDEYSRGVAADGFAAYAENVWETIRANRELDIPTQKEMLAHVRCEQIAREVVQVVDQNLHAVKETLMSPGEKDAEVVEALFELLYRTCEDAIAMYDAKAFRYSPVVAELKGTDLKAKLSGDCKMLFDAQVALASDGAVRQFREKVGGSADGASPWKDWGNVWKGALEQSLNMFDQACGTDKLKEKTEMISGAHPMSFAQGSYTTARKRLGATLDEEVKRATGEVNLAARSHCQTVFCQAFKAPMESVLENAGADVWDRASEVGQVCWEVTATEAKEVYGADGLGLGDNEIEQAVEDDIKPMCYERAMVDIKNAVGNPNNLLLRMTKRFDDSFRFDERGIPRHFGANENIEELFVEARAKGEELVELLGEIRLGGELTRLRSSARNIDKKVMESVILPEHLRTDLRQKLRRQANVVCMEAKRAQEVAKLKNNVPYWIIGLIVILGWNELMVILRSPLLLVLTVVVVPMVYLSYTLNANTVLGPAIRATLAPVLEQVKAFIDSFSEGDGGAGTGGPGVVASMSSDTVISGNLGRAGHTSSNIGSGK